MIYRFTFAMILTLVFAFISQGQTSTFIYQGKLQDGGIAANGTYQFEFRLFDAALNGNQVGQTISNVSTTVSNGIFAVNLDFGAASFDGAPRFLDIAVRLSASGQPYTALNPRQPVTSTPYAVRSLNANVANTAINSANLGGIPAAQYVVTTDPRMSDDRNPLPGSPNYIQNTQSQQASSNFNISGTGKAGIVDVVTQYNIGGSRVLSAGGTDNLIAGVGAGTANTGGFNAFFGSQSGKLNTTGSSNSFFGSYSGSSNTAGNSNSFFGINSGGSNTDGASNSFFGGASGFSNTSGGNNSYFGVASGQSNTLAANNSMFGFSAGKQNTAGGNTFVGAFSGEKNTTGSFNSYIGLRSGKDTFTGSYNVYVGYEAGAGNQGGSNNTYIGSATKGIGSKNTFVGYSIDGSTGNTNAAVGSDIVFSPGISRSAGIGWNVSVQESDTIVLGNIDTTVKIPGAGIYSFGSITTPSTVQAGTLKGTSLNVGSALFQGSLQVGGAVNADGDVNGNAGNYLGALTAQYLGVRSINVGGNIALCIQSPIPNSPNRFLSECSSSRRYKDNIESFTGGLEILRRLRPVTFNWKSNGAKDVGFVAEEVNEIEPLLNNYNADGQIEGVKYGQITTVLVNSVKEQQTQIEQLEERIKKQNETIELLKALICAANKDAAVCAEIGGRK